MKNTYKQKGVTLIALIITIIVLLILAGVAFAALSGQNGLLTRASNAAQTSQIEKYKEEIELDIAEKQVEKLGMLTRDDLVAERYLEVDYTKEINGYLYEIGEDLKVVYTGRVSIRFDPMTKIGDNLAKTTVTVENVENELDEGSLEYVWSNDNVNPPETGWLPLSVSDTGQLLEFSMEGSWKGWYCWIRYKLVNGGADEWFYKKSGVFRI